MGRGEYTSIGAERGERGGHRGGWGERGERGGRGWGGRGWGGRGWGGGWPYYSSYALPYYSSSYVVPSYSYAAPVLPAYDITDGGTVYPTGQSYVPSYGGYGGYGWPYAALPFYGAAAAFPHWRSRRHFLHRHRRRVHHILGQDLD